MGKRLTHQGKGRTEHSRRERRSRHRQQAGTHEDAQQRATAHAMPRVRPAQQQSSCQHQGLVAAEAQQQHVPSQCCCVQVPRLQLLRALEHAAAQQLPRHCGTVSRSTAGKARHDTSVHVEGIITHFGSQKAATKPPNRPCAVAIAALA